MYSSITFSIVIWITVAYYLSVSICKHYSQYKLHWNYSKYFLLYYTQFLKNCICSVWETENLVFWILFVFGRQEKTPCLWVSFTIPVAFKSLTFSKVSTCTPVTDPSKPVCILWLWAWNHTGQLWIHTWLWQVYFVKIFSTLKWKIVKAPIKITKPQTLPSSRIRLFSA